MCATIGRWWKDADADYIQSRRITRDPDPKSRRGDIGIIGYSPSAGFVVTVVIRFADHSGVNAWKTSGADLRAYQQGEEGTR